MQLVKSNAENNYLDRLQIVVLDCPYASIQDPQTQKIFSKFMATKLGGYMQEYPYGVLPMDRYDMMATLLLLCEKKDDGDLEPIAVFKSTSLERCKLFNADFELMEYYHSEGTEVYKQATLDILESAYKRGVNVGYNSSWTIQKHIREDKEKVRLARDLSFMMFANHYPHYNIEEVLITGVVKFKVDQVLTWMGFNHLKSQNTTLPPIACPFLFGEKTAVMHLTQFSSEVKALATKYQALWNERLILGGLNQDMLLKKAA